MRPVTNAAQTEKQAAEAALLFGFVYLPLNDAFEEIWLPKAIFKLELGTVSLFKYSK